MYLCIDAHYSANSTVAAAVTFQNIDSDQIEREYLRKTGPADEYHPGNFYKRELPVVLQLLRQMEHNLQAIFVDGHVWLTADLQPGLGAHLYRALDERVPVIGVAKNPYRHCTAVAEVLRGGSRKPLYVTAAGMRNDAAAEMVRKMHGPYRIPTLLKHVDSLSRRS